MPADVGEAQLRAGMRPFFADDDTHALGPAGQVEHAGEHTQMDHFGYMEGAIRSGERAARLLLDQLCSSRRRWPATAGGCSTAVTSGRGTWPRSNGARTARCSWTTAAETPLKRRRGVPGGEPGTRRRGRLLQEARFTGWCRRCRSG
ncbi:hypothetical protein DI270_002295 [Microbispora triticiradicis]|uniref:Amine oxidase domain-containing protein n=2 Tax=Microbispora triticiradicis TaxID=2200763 RepID=A0ABX9LRY5_9ACTN|nr:hypothetical protein DI270_002295 [Microbispora triticiradicis]